MNWFKRLPLILLVLCGLTAAVPDKTTTIFVIGDSTAANKGQRSRYRLFSVRSTGTGFCLSTLLTASI